MIAILSIGGSAILGVLFVLVSIKKKALSLDDYITYRHKSSYLMTAISLSASVLGGWILFNPIETGTWAGITGLIGYSLGQAMPLFVLAFLGPHLTQRLPQGYGLSDFVYHRYGKRSAQFTSLLMIFYMGTFLTAELSAIGQVLSYIFHIPLILTCSLTMIIIFAYVFRGGLGASIYTDKIQLYLLVPMIIALFVGVGLKEGFQSLTLNSDLINLSYIPGIKFGFVLLIGVTASNLFHQGFWQRVYSLKQETTQPKAFILGGILVIPIIILIGLLGIIATNTGVVNPNEPSLALFPLIERLSPYFTIIIILLTSVLVMSSIDTLLNGLVSTIISWKGVKEEENKSLRKAQSLTILIGIIAILLGSRGGSVLYFFLVADLVCSAFAFPLTFGLFNKKINGAKALIAGTLATIIGALFFPKYDYTSWSGLPADMLISFSLALILSIAFTLSLSIIRSHNE
ncbi:sodium:solute symporter family transporter [Spirochaeta cellobiosiphila]|uniref:sodium:solute symporter family transporter n=1 Tax=Spirochaeta cellobiosiphila TaxID=504483 RepID=UPI0004045F02|nr:hypothetical protein [Spirochaeta cellobiosiphila]